MCAIEKEIMDVTIEARLSNGNLLTVNYRPQKYASVTRLSPAFHARVWLRETNCV